jgi:hypothetical protein
MEMGTPHCSLGNMPSAFSLKLKLWSGLNDSGQIPKKKRRESQREQSAPEDLIDRARNEDRVHKLDQFDDKWRSIFNVHRLHLPMQFPRKWRGASMGTRVFCFAGGR